MSKKLGWFCAAVLSVLWTLAPAKASSQAVDELIHACYIPLVGVIYRIKAAGLPTACLAKSHIEFEWNAQGPKGDRGDVGPAGNLALAGQSCPSGYFVAGFSSTGGLTCRNSSGQEPSGPPTASALSGSWTLSAPSSPLQLTSTCTSQSYFEQVWIAGMTTAVNASNQLTISGKAMAQPSGGAPQPFVFTSATAATVTDPLAFPIVVELHTSNQLTSPVSGTISTDFIGTFSSLTTFNGSIAVTPTLNAPGGEALSCTRIQAIVTATRTP